MDTALVFGLVVAWISVGMCLMLEGNTLSSFLHLSSFILVIGGSLGATVIGTRFQDVGYIVKSFSKVFFPSTLDFGSAIAQIRDLAIKARREGLLSLEDSISSQRDEFVQIGLRLVVDGVDSEKVRKILETKAFVMDKVNRVGVKFFESMGGYAPTLGIVGTVLGLVNVLAHLAEPDRLGEGIAQAFVATLYGIASANLIFLPVATKMQTNAEKEAHYYEMLQEAILSIQGGDNPSMLEQKLRAFTREDEIPAGEY